MRPCGATSAPASWLSTVRRSLALAGELARGALGPDRDGQRAGFLRLVAQAAELAPGR